MNLSNQWLERTGMKASTDHGRPCAQEQSRPRSNIPDKISGAGCAKKHQKQSSISQQSVRHEQEMNRTSKLSGWYSIQKHLCPVQIGDPQIKVGITSLDGGD